MSSNHEFQSTNKQIKIYHLKSHLDSYKEDLELLPANNDGILLTDNKTNEKKKNNDSSNWSKYHVTIAGDITKGAPFVLFLGEKEGGGTFSKIFLLRISLTKTFSSALCRN